MKAFTCALLGVLIFFTSCNKGDTRVLDAQNQRDQQPRAQELSPYKWYYFDIAGIKRIDSVRNVPSVVKRPWTEAIRISSASVAADTSIRPPKGYAIVNRLGIIEFDENDFSFFPDASLFNGRTAGNLVFYENFPVFLLYKNSFFNEAAEMSPTEFHPFLAQFSPNTHISSPIIAIENLKFTRESEIVDFIWDGTVWNCSVKTISGDRTAFSYISLQPRSPLLSLTPSNATKSLFITDSDREIFRALKMPEDFSKSPARLQELFSQISNSIPFRVTCYTAGGNSPREYLNQKAGNGRLPLLASACIAETWICGVFQDGTVYMRGALYDRPFFNNNETVAFKLPRLPAGYVYSDCVITAKTLFVGWEESAFFETGRSGFISVDLDLIVR